MLVDISKARKLYLIKSKDDLNGHGSHCLWINPRLEGPKGVLNLSELKWEYANSSSGLVSINKAHNNSKIFYKGKVQKNSIFSHANSLVIFSIPPGYKYFKAQGDQ